MSVMICCNDPCVVSERPVGLTPILLQLSSAVGTRNADEYFIFNTSSPGSLDRDGSCVPMERSRKDLETESAFLSLFIAAWCVS